MTINWYDGTHFDIPLKMGLIGIGLIITVLLLIFIITARAMAKKTYVCQKCGERFKAKWYKFLLFGQYLDNKDYILRCPHCGKKGVCSQSYKQDRV